MIAPHINSIFYYILPHNIASYHISVHLLLTQSAVGRGEIKKNSECTKFWGSIYMLRYQKGPKIPWGLLIMFRWWVLIFSLTTWKVGNMGSHIAAFTTFSCPPPSQVFPIILLKRIPKLYLVWLCDFISRIASYLKILKMPPKIMKI